MAYQLTVSSQYEIARQSESCSRHEGYYSGVHIVSDEEHNFPAGLDDPPQFWHGIQNGLSVPSVKRWFGNDSVKGVIPEWQLPRVRHSRSVVGYLRKSGAKKCIRVSPKDS